MPRSIFMICYLMLYFVIFRSEINSTWYPCGHPFPFCTCICHMGRKAVGGITAIVYGKQAGKQQAAERGPPPSPAGMLRAPAPALHSRQHSTPAKYRPLHPARARLQTRYPTAGVKRHVLRHCQDLSEQQKLPS